MAFSNGDRVKILSGIYAGKEAVVLAKESGGRVPVFMDGFTTSSGMRAYVPASLQAATDPPPPVGISPALLSGAAGDGKIDLSWVSGSGTPLYWEVWINNTWAVKLPADSRSWAKTGLTNGQPVTVRVVAYDAASHANSNTITLTPTGTPVPGWPGPLIVDDQFQTIDTNRWFLYATPGNHADEPGIRSPAAWSIVDGRLVCTARNAPDGQIVTGGMSMKLSQRGGRWETRVRCDADPTGSLSAVVLLWPSGSSRRSDGEIDFYETGTKAGTRTPVYTFVHYGAERGDFQQQFTHQIDGTQWHTFAIEWEPDKALRIFVNGVLSGTITDPAKMPIAKDHLCVQFDAFAKRTLPSPLRMEVDYVKVWSL